MDSILELKKQIKEGEFKSIYFFYGDEEYLIKTYVDRIKNFFIDSPLASDLNLFLFDGNVDLNDVISSSEKYPQFCEKIVVIVKDSGLLKSDSKQIKVWLKDLPSHLVIIFVEKSLSMLSKSIGREIENIGMVVEFPFQSNSVLSKWIKQKLDKHNKNMSLSDMSYLIDICNKSMSKLEIELNKLVCYCSCDNEHTNISKKEIDLLVHSSVDLKVFALIDRLLQKDGIASYKMLSEFQRSRELPTLIIAAIFSQLQLIVMIDDLRSDGHNDFDKFVSPNRKFLVKKFASKKYDCENFKYVMSLCSRYDTEIKAGQIEGYTALEIIVATLLK